MINAKDAYADIELSTDVLSASNHRLIQLLLDKCTSHIESSKKYISNNDIAKKAKAIEKALAILSYLRICLNHDNEQTKKLSELLDSLYAYSQNNLVQANIKNDVKYLNEAHHVMVNIKSGWDGISGVV
jgi:flagellar protein FliS